ncbi:DUF1684 domain-containing protein [Paracrocinitomix mangrovi]|uniref:DUF1684 domain-containing protein n=1 Tax=Paracrocinitomix mangrovi TaxID=2862509 RepID=UPI001EDA3BC5|nr:DUF1684 domain-containing protein [Paracrocinitomix mangrovi]UKN03623.1 DUF1684 domain-containing protein [Paracrocinitomix mangrovi]
MKLFSLTIILISSVWAIAQTEDSLFLEVKTFQKEQNEHYWDKEQSPLKKKERKKFKGHNFFEIDLNYRVNARVEVLENQDTIVMPTSAGTEKKYLRYAKLHFVIDSASYVLTAYMSAKLQYQDYLFIPFTDQTSGNETYGGGRYLDIEVPQNDSVIINFNLAYNPYCAYTSGWFCPFPPAENNLNVAIKAGLMAPDLH